MRIVKQQDQSGCAIACIATVLKRSYENVKQDWFNDFQLEGIDLEKTIGYLADAGCSIIRKQSLFYIHKDDTRKEMLAPFAPIHLVRVIQKFDADQGHLVVMDKDGGLHCPAGMTDEDIRQSYMITDVLGVYR